MTAKQGGALEIVQRRSGIGYDSKQKATLKALGLGKVGRTRTHPDNEQVRGMIHRIRHLVEVRPAGEEA